MPDTHFAIYLRALDACDDPQGALGEEEVIHPPSPDFGYDITPANVLTFGGMGVDGVHYAVLNMGGGASKSWPVIQISPMDFSKPYTALADSFLSFMATCCGVTPAELSVVFDREQAGVPSVVEFLKTHFDMARVWAADLPPPEQYLKAIRSKG